MVNRPSERSTEHVGTLRFSDSPVTYVVAAVMLAAAMVALLWVPSYAKLTPSLGGLPFFYWYSLLWLLLNAGLQLGAYQLIVARPRRRHLRGAAPSRSAQP